MAVYDFDASAVVKYSVTEPGSAWVRQLIDARGPRQEHALHLILVAEVTQVEVAAGLAVIERVGRIRRAQRVREYQRFTSHLIQRYAILPVTTDDFVVLWYLPEYKIVIISITYANMSLSQNIERASNSAQDL